MLKEDGKAYDYPPDYSHLGRHLPPTVSEVLSGKEVWWRKTEKFLGGYNKPHTLFAVVSEDHAEVFFRYTNGGSTWTSIGDYDLWYPIKVPK